MNCSMHKPNFESSKVIKVSFTEITQKILWIREYIKVNEVLQGSILGSKHTTDVTNRGVHLGGRGVGGCAFYMKRGSI